MNFEERHKLALQIADQLNNDPLLTQDLEPWLNDPTRSMLQGSAVSISELQSGIESLKEDSASIKELERKIERDLEYLDCD